MLRLTPKRDADFNRLAARVLKVTGLVLFTNAQGDKITGLTNTSANLNFNGSSNWTVLTGSGGIIFTVSGSATQLVYDTSIPTFRWGNSAMSLGKTDVRWTNIYGGNGDFSGGLTLKYLAKTSNYTLTTTDYLIDCTTNSFTLTLPTSVSVAGQVYILNNSGNGTITVNTTSSELVNGAASGTITISQYENISVMSTGSAWIIINRVGQGIIESGSFTNSN